MIGIRDDNRFIAVDQGNSLLKLTLFEGDRPRETCRFTDEDTEDIFSVVERWNPHSGAYCSVGKMDSRLVESLRLALDGRFLVLSRSTAVPLGIDYSTPSTLGLDRIALASGAVKLYAGKTVAVVDSGTAVTLDVVDGSGVFRGGRITAGIRLRFESLHSRTSALPLVDARGPMPVAGNSTETAIRSGVVLGLADEITETFRQYKESYGCDRLVMTGGDGSLLFDSIQSRIPADLVPDLMAHGLFYIYKYNEI